MRLHDIEFFMAESTGTDALGNETNAYVSIGTDKGRMTHWTSEEIALIPREVTTTQEKIITKAPLAVCRKASRIIYDDKTYTIKAVHEMTSRWTILQVVAYAY